MATDDVVVIRRPVLRGHQLIDGLWLPRERFDEQAAARLILSQWQTGASAWRFADGDLLRFRQALPVHCESLVGWPLVRQGRGLCSALLGKEELAGLPPADLWLVRGSRVDALHLRDAEVLAPGQWIDISDYTLLDTYDCRSTLPEPDLDLLAPPVDMREVFGDALAPVSPEREGVMQALLERQQQARAEAQQPPRKSSAKASENSEWNRGEASSFPWKHLVFVLLVFLGLRWLAAGGGGTLSPEHGEMGNGVLKMIAAMVISAIVFTLVLAAAGKWLRRSRPASGVDPSTLPGWTPSAAQPAPIPPRATPTRPREALWRRMLTRLTRNSRLSRLYGKRQAEYMKRMLAMFENGDLAEALRHAIPLGGGQQDSGEQSFGTPRRRDDLSIKEQQGTARSLFFEQAMEDHLRKLYRQSFERLDREGRIDEAAFVLAELLKSREEALDYLESHGRHVQAADLALAWDMSSSQIVRLLCLAEDWQRAVMVARRDDAFADAVVLLQDKAPESAERLRLEWAEALTGKGLWLQAVDVVWSLPAERHRAAQWLLDAEAAGGQLAIGALVKRAMLLPDTLEAHGERIQQLRDEPARHAERAVLAKALLEHKNRGGALAWLAGAVVNSLVADQAGGQGQLTPDQLKALIKMSQDNLLLADLPAQVPPFKGPLPLSRVEEVQQWLAPERGSRAIVDAVPLHDQRYLVALGEAGAAVVDVQGKTLFHFPVPAQAIVIGHSRQVALVLARRDEVWRVSKLDLVNRSASDLGVLRLDVFARSFDGTGWTIGHGRQLRVVDADRGFATLWHVSDLPGRVMAMKDDEANEALWLMLDDNRLEVWHYRLPERRLASKDEAPQVKHENGFMVLEANGRFTQANVRHNPHADPVLVLERDGNRKGYRLPGLVDDGLWEDPVSLHLTDPWLVVCYAIADGGTRIYFTHSGSDQLCASLDWPGVVMVRNIGAEWMLFDGEGRLSHVSVAQGRQWNLGVD